MRLWDFANERPSNAGRRVNSVVGLGAELFDALDEMIERVNRTRDFHAAISGPEEQGQTSA